MKCIQPKANGIRLVSGLHMNQAKSSIMVAGLFIYGVEDLARANGIKLVFPPTKYLGMPLVASRLGASTLILPTTISEKLQQMCTEFIWDGADMTKKIHPINEEKLCTAKEFGGLGITKIADWNRAAICGLVYKLATKQDNLWVKWMWANKIKANNFWTMTIPKDCLWSWRNILDRRVNTQKMVKKRITDGTSTSFWPWHDPWLGGPLLAKRVDASIKEASGIHDQAIVSTLIIAGTWNCSHFAMPAAIKEEIHNTVLFTRADPDRWTWTISKHGNYTTPSAYKGIRRIETPLWWNKLVWSKWALPRHNFLMWQAGTSWCSLDTE
ncbi:hypothetical protein IFM89_023414 [Coptis chinensis]|uniref:Reverse transcriptase zinc-binding domain-containing protein n=1 Tax=Coptis chinensis TaxID=261450 RepID=A0A835H079_9MAGN|nr:hypothetical protein IFM89_023414 [Coptis chinensis]